MELTQAQYQLIEPHLPVQRGNVSIPNIQVLNAIRGEVEVDQPLEEFVLIDGNGRVQIPRDLLDELNIGEKARVQVEDGIVTIRPGD